MLILDYNEDRSLQISSEEKRVADDVQDSKGTMDLDAAVQSVQGVSAKVHIGTLSPYSNFDEGVYTMTLVKNIRAKDAFLKMPLPERKCEAELYEVCRTRKLLGQCNCVPWESSNIYQVKKKKQVNNWPQYFPMQDMQICSPNGRDCIEQHSAKTFNCSLACEGIFADISWKVAEMENKKDKKKYQDLSSEYQDLKKKHVKYFRFNSNDSSKMFGK